VNRYEIECFELFNYFINDYFTTVINIASLDLPSFQEFEG